MTTRINVHHITAVSVMHTTLTMADARTLYTTDITATDADGKKITLVLFHDEPVPMMIEAAE